jgi:hypothetical protein
MMQTIRRVFSHRLLPELSLVVGMIALCVASRLLPHPPNFTPLGAAALFAGATMSRTWKALALPLTAMLLSDLLIGMHTLAPVIYLAMGGYVLLGRRLATAGGPVRIVTSSLIGSTLFFLITNGAVWMVSYEATLAGLTRCYATAIPFFGNTVAGDLSYSVLLFGLATAAQRVRFPVIRRAETC